ncbi:MAG: tetratricopeptide repeat protein [Oscillatoriales cyanobacterium C42_A2020_001]|nr:tetratricopeptide repeat protein [Leptolyngbyaceae cyanobacterium C42_A2020_001]
MIRGWVVWQVGMMVMLAGVGMGGDHAIAQMTPPTTQQAQPEQPTNDQPISPPKVQPQQPTQQKPDAKRKPAPLDQFPPNPLEVTSDDPLVPYDYKDRPLTAEEQREISAAADRLTLIGAKRLQAGDAVGAFEAWNQELRYRRLLGLLTQEVQALGRVGDVAWLQNNNLQLRYITRRLDQIRLQTERPLADLEGDRKTSPELLTTAKRILLVEALGLAYQQVRLPKIAASLYEQVLTDARQRNDSLKTEAILIVLGQLHLGWFDYASAAKVYQELLQRAQARQDLFNEPIYLTQLVFIHEQAKQPAQAIPYQQQLIQFYQKVNDPKPVPKVITQIADNQRLLGRLDLAEANYQLAYKTAQPQLLFADAGDALKKLGEMYRANNRLDSAQRIYAFLVSIEQQAYNTYGIMNAYDQLGQIYLLQKEYPAAIAAFQSGLAIARQLKFREDHFTAQIQQATQADSGNEK